MSLRRYITRCISLYVKHLRYKYTEDIYANSYFYEYNQQNGISIESLYLLYTVTMHCWKF